MNDFEKYLIENKKKLEPDTIDEKIWMGMENQLLKRKSRRIVRTIKYIAVAASILIAGLFVYTNQYQASIEEQLLAKYNLKEHNFTQQVAQRKAKLSKATIPQDELEDFQVLLQQLEFLDGQFQDYTKYIEENGYQEFIGNQIVNHYKSKIKLLDKIQSEIEKINYYESKKPSNSEPVEIKI